MKQKTMFTDWYWPEIRASLFYLEPPSGEYLESSSVYLCADSVVAFNHSRNSLLPYQKILAKSFDD